MARTRAHQWQGQGHTKGKAKGTPGAKERERQKIFLQVRTNPFNATGFFLYPLKTEIHQVKRQRSSSYNGSVIP